MKIKENVIRLVTLGKIPNDSDMSNELFNEYDKLILSADYTDLEL